MLTSDEVTPAGGFVHNTCLTSLCLAVSLFFPEVTNSQALPYWLLMSTHVSMIYKYIVKKHLFVHDIALQAMP